jgi:outer membrane protein
VKTQPLDGCGIGVYRLRPHMRSLGLFAVVLFGATSAQAQDDVPPSQPELPHVQLEGNAPPTIKLNDAVATALSRNPTAAVAYAEIRRAQAIVEQVRSASLPTLYGNLTYTRLDSPRIYLGTVQDPANTFQANALLTVPLIVPKPWAQWSQATDQVDVARLSAGDTRRLVAVSVARAYLSVVAQKRVIDAAVRARDTDKAHYEYSHQRFAGGVGNRIDEVRADQQLASDEANVQQQYSNLARDREALGVLVGVSGPLDADEPVLDAPRDPQQAMNDAEHRSDVQVSGARLHAAKHAVRDDWTDYSPYLSGTFLPFYENPPLVAYPTTGWEAELILAIPIYDGGLRYGQEKERGVARDEAQVQLDATLRQARSDVRTAFEELRRADSSLAEAREAAKLAESGLELANVAYRAGASTNIEVIDAERTARDAELAVAIAEDGAREARVDLLAATGRFP